MNGRQIEPDELSGSGNTIVYRRWDGQAWTEPVDILAVAGDSLADFVAAAVDSQNQLHLVWTGLVNLYYSSAPAAAAGSIRAWSTPQVIAADSARSEWESDVAVDTQDTVHIVFATKGVSAGVYHIKAASGSTSWAAPVRISDLLRANEVAFKDVRLVIDTADRLHAAWGTVSTSSFNQALFYARSEGSGETWDQPVMLADTIIERGWTGLPSLLPYGLDELLLIYAGEGAKGRVERTSIDAGKTWSEPRLILSSMEGINGFLIPLVDNIGNLHLVIDMRSSADQRVGIYYAPRAGLDWAPIIPVAVDEPYGPSAHYTDAAVRLGNEIHVVWDQARGAEIWYVKGTISGVPAMPPAPTLPAATAVPALQATEPTVASGEPADTSPAPTSQAFAGLPAQPVRSSSVASALIVALIPVLVLVGGSIIWQMRKR